MALALDGRYKRLEIPLSCEVEVATEGDEEGDGREQGS